MRKHFVVFLSPGTLFSEQTTKPIDEWDTHLAADIAKQISERHGAKPYGFQFTTCLVPDFDVPDGEGGVIKVIPKEVKRSGTYWLTGRILSYDQIAPTPQHKILLSNMRCNRDPIAIENNNSYRFTGIFGEKDKVVDREGNIIEHGDDSDLVEYRKVKIEDWEEEDKRNQ